MIALVFSEQERETSILVSTKHTDYQFVVQVPSPFEGSTTVSRGSLGWSSGQGSSGFPPVPTALCVGHRGGTGWPLFEKVVWFLLPGTPLEQATGSSTARSPEFLAVAMKLWVHLPASTSLSLIPCYPVWEREGPVCRLLRLHVFLWLRVWAGSVYFSIHNFIPSAKNSRFSIKSHWALFLKIWKILFITNLNRAPDLYQLLWLLAGNTEMFLLA